MNNSIESEAIKVLECLEDSVEYLCDSEQLSGEKVWTMIYGLADYKLSQFPVTLED